MLIARRMILGMIGAGLAPWTARAQRQPQHRIG